MVKLKAVIFSILETESHKSYIGRAVNILIVSLIILNVGAVILSTVDTFAIQHTEWFERLEYFSVVVFSIEYILRVWVSNIRRGYQHPILGRLKYMLTPMALIDLFTIIPFFLVIGTSIDIRFITLMRFMRLLRIFKLKRYSHALHTLGKVVTEKKEELVIVFFTIIVLMIMASSLMYLIEHHAQPNKFSSIPATMWWAVTTLTTVGYGDMVPITPFGKILSAIISMLGIAMFALPAALMSSGFTEQIQLQRRRRKMHRCPHCLKEINGEDLK
ncbi:MAG: ion transporter [Cytophagaceae bacterium]|jgi:voltage-gated potassium channel|nr:ion transporter [Cytophagaceae bacterium]